MASHFSFDTRFRVGGASLLVAFAVGGLVACGDEAMVQPATAVEAGEATKVEAVPTEAQPKGSGCVKDVDCKGDRVCEDGKCVAPH